MFRGCRQEDMPPHIYSVGQAAYRDMVSTRRDQSVVFMGRSGSGKTTNFRHVLHYLALSTPSSSPVLTGIIGKRYLAADRTLSSQSLKYL